MESLLSQRKINILELKTGKHNELSDYLKNGEKEGKGIV